MALTVPRSGAAYSGFLRAALVLVSPLHNHLAAVLHGVLQGVDRTGPLMGLGLAFAGSRRLRKRFVRGYGSRAAVALVPAAQRTPPAFQYSARSTAMGCV